MRNKILFVLLMITLICVALALYMNQVNRPDNTASSTLIFEPEPTSVNEVPIPSSTSTVSEPSESSLPINTPTVAPAPDSSLAPTTSPTPIPSPTPSPVPVILSDDTKVELPDGFVDLAEFIPEIVIDLRYYTDNNFVGRPLAGYEAPRAILTKEAAAALLEIQIELSIKNLGLKVFDAYRPESAVADIVQWAADLEDTKMKPWYYPEMSKEDIIKKGFIAVHSAHSRGSTVDLTLIDLDTEEELDMGCGFDFFGDAARYNYDGITETQRSNRKLLRDMMVSHGFHIVDRGEWWHFRFKDEPYPGTYFDFPVK